MKNLKVIAFILLIFSLYLLEVAAQPRPDMTITKTHTGTWLQGDTGRTYTLTASNAGNASTSGTVTVVDTLPTGLTATAISGTGWSCVLATLTCTRSDVLGRGNSYPSITVTVNVASNAPSSVTNIATVSGGGETNTSNNTASDPTTIVVPAPDLTVTKTHIGSWLRGDTGRTYSIVVRNSGTIATSGTVSMTDTLPTGLTATAISGTGWSCTLATLTCSRSDSLAAGSNYPTITLTVDVSISAPSSVTNTATVSGGGETNTSNNTANDPTGIYTITYTSCGPVWATEYRSGAFFPRLYSLSGTTATLFSSLPPTQNMAAIAQGTDAKMYFDNGATTSIYNYDGATTNLLTGGTWQVWATSSGPGGGWNGNMYYVSGNYRLYEVTQTGIVTDLGALIPRTGDTVYNTLQYGDVASDANGRIYWFASTGGSGNSFLYRIDKNTLRLSNLGDTGPNSASGLAFDSSGQLITTNVPSAGVTNTYAINPATLAFTNVGSVTGLQTSASVYDLASCNLPAFNPILSMTKSVANVTTSTNPATLANPGDVLEYTITITNSGNLAADSTSLSDSIPSGTTYVANSTTMNGIAVADVGGLMPFDPANTSDRYVDSPGQPLGVVAVGSGNEAVIKFRVTVNSSGLPGTISNAATTNYPTVSGGVTTFVNVSSNSADVSTGGTLRSISGKVFEDYNYGGGAGRSFVTSGGSARQNATVELYNSSGAFVASTTTDASGNYTFSGLGIGTYTVRVVNSTVTSSRTGYVSTLRPVQTYRIDASSGTVTAVTDRVGGENPCSTDAGVNSTSATLASLTSGTLSGTTNGTCAGQPQNVPQSIASVSISSADISGVDFGFNFNTIVNPKDVGQGSLRQFITNANALANAGLAQSGRTAAIDNSIFMIPNGTSSAGLRSSLNYFSGGTVTISPASNLTTVTSPIIIDGTIQPGWTSTPIVVLDGNAAPSVTNTWGLTVSGGGSTLRGMVIHRFYDDQIHIITSGNNLIVGNYVGLSADGMSVPTRVSPGAGDGIDLASSNNIVGGTTVADRNIIAGYHDGGVQISSGTNNQVIGNYIGTNYLGSAALVSGQGTEWVGIEVRAGSGHIIGGTTVTKRNVISGNRIGIWIGSSSSGTTIQGNYVGVGADGTTAIGNTEWGIGSASNNNTIGGTSAGAGNIIANNTFDGIRVDNNYTGNAIRQNSIYANGGLGIDHADNGVTANDGTVSTTLANKGYDYPIFTSVQLSGTTLTVKGFVGKNGAIGNPTFANASIEIFKANNSPANQNGEVILTDGLSKPHGEGQTYLGTITADANGLFNTSLAVSGLSAGDSITATATDATNNTSEFSPNFTVDYQSIVAFKSVKLTTDADSSGYITPGDTMTYTLQYVNVGNVSVTSFQINDQLPSDLTISATGGQTVTVSGSGTSASKNSSYTGAASGAVSDLLASGAVLAPGGVITVTIPIKINADATGTKSNQALATGTEILSSGVSTDNAGLTSDLPSTVTGSPYNITIPAGSVSQTLSNSIDSTTFAISSLPDLAIAKSHTGSFTVGSTGTYNLTITNSGGGPSFGTITVTDNLPTGLSVNGGAAGAVTLSGTNAANWTCNSDAASPQVITCTSSTAIAASGTSTFGFTVNVGLGTAIGTNAVTNNASVSGGGEVVTTNNSATDPTTILSPDLTIVKSHSGNFSKGATGTYQIVIENSGTSATTGTITVSDSLPTGLSVSDGALTIGGADSANWSCSATSNVITCTSSTSIATSGSSTFTFNVNVSSTAPDSVTNTASVSGGNEATANNGNNSASDPTNTTSNPPNIELIKSCPSPSNCTTAPQLPGTDLTYKIQFTNIGGLPAMNLRLVDGVPINTDFKVGSAGVNTGTTGLTFVIEYSSDYDPLNPTLATWTYTPVSGGGSAPAGYDRNVKAIRWRVTSGNLSNISPNNIGDISFITRIR